MKNTIKKLFPIILSYKKELILTIVATLIISIVCVVDSLLLSYTIDNVLYSNAKLTLISIAIIMIFIGAFQICLRGIKNLLIQKISYNMDIDLMSKFFKKVLIINYPFFENHKTGELTSRLNDTRLVRNAFSEGLITIISNVIMFFVIGATLIYINKTLFLLQCIFIIFLTILILIFAKFFKKEYPISMQKGAEFQSFLTQSFSSIETIKAYPAIRMFCNEYCKKKEDSIKTDWNITEKYILQGSLYGLIDRISSVLLLVFGAFFVMNEKMSLGQVISFISLSGFFTSSVEVLLDLQAGIQEAFAAINRLFEVLDEVEEKSFGIKVTNNIPTIIFKNISFSYKKDEQLYTDFSLKIDKGKWVCFIGKTGCGKTTIVKLLLKFYTVQSGKIFWDDYEISQIDTNQLREKIAYIPQELVLFSGTILENITMYDLTVSKEKVIEVTKKVGIYDKIMTLEKKFDTLVGERGLSLSGGEKQKIAICRALIKGPVMIILDEATSNLDNDSEEEVLQVIKQLHKEGKTIISIAHRLKTTKMCDEVYKLEKGKIVE